MDERIRRTVWFQRAMISFSLSLLVASCGDVPSCREEAQLPSNSTRVALYAGDGTSDISVRAADKMFQWMGYSVTRLTANDIIDDGLDAFNLLCVPGGDMYQYAQDLSLPGIERIRRFVGDGGGYIGICGGACLTGERVVWQGNELPMTSLELFPGTTRGPIDEIAPYPDCTMCKLNIVEATHPITQSTPDTAWILYCYGPLFVVDTDAQVSVLGRYEIGNRPAMAAYGFGLGRVFIIGTHPEFEEDSERDDVEWGDTFDDEGSVWELMRKAALWCLKSEDVRSERRSSEGEQGAEGTFRPTIHFR